MKKLIRRALAIALIAMTLATALAVDSVKTTGKINMRRGAGLDRSIITTVPKDTWVDCYDSEYDARGVEWFYVYYDGSYGWISSNYTTEKDSDYSGYVQSSAMASSGYVTTTGKTYLRYGPSMSKNIRTTVPKSKKLYYTDTEFDERGICWVYVNYNGYGGWISTRYTAEYGEWDAGHSGASGTVYTTGSVTIRSEPDKDSSALGTVPSDRGVTYEGRKEYDSRGVLWYKITYKGTTGWISSKYSYLD